ncbi:hypothetical protein [Burkholderia ubonensis]|uniref:hypothetical protein n=1 Tax=Burkholderia ubonensis TaxID=101571 RepID=UPI0009B55F61|nr:hypothetical protein [Burkholderia ubonensis]
MRAGVAVAWLLVAGVAHAQQDPDLAALSLQSGAPQAEASPRAWQLFAEGGTGWSRIRTESLSNQTSSIQRLSADLRIDATPLRGLRAVLSDRLDYADWPYQIEPNREVNTLREAYLSVQPSNSVIFDAGRINQYSGVAVGYNPTDFFRGGAVRSLVTLDPLSIKNNRQGSVMVRGQMLWDGGSVMALFSPKLASRANNAPFNPDWGSTNGVNRAMLIFSKRISANLNPQWLLYQEQGGSVQFGMNLTTLVNDSTVAYVEWSGGRRNTLLQDALGQGGDKAFRNRLSTGFTYTTSNKLSLTFEYEYNGAGLDKGSWDALPATSLPGYVRYQQYAMTQQEMATRHALLFYATWQDVVINHLNLSALVRYSVADRSNLSWLELRYRWPHDEVAVQWLNNSGKLFSTFGASPLRTALELSYRHYF